MAEPEYRPERAALGRILKRYRECARLQLDDAARGLNVTARELNNWEQGIGHPNEVLFQEMLKLYHVSPEAQRKLYIIWGSCLRLEKLRQLEARAPRRRPPRRLTPKDNPLLDRADINGPKDTNVGY